MTVTRPAHDPERRAALVDYVGTLRQSWAGSLGGTESALRR